MVIADLVFGLIFALPTLTWNHIFDRLVSTLPWEPQWKLQRFGKIHCCTQFLASTMSAHPLFGLQDSVETALCFLEGRHDNSLVSQDSSICKFSCISAYGKNTQIQNLLRVKWEVSGAGLKLWSPPLWSC
jgi:hypothetical protein